MKRIAYIVLSIVVIGAIGYYLFSGDAPYRWYPTFDQRSKQPFGCAMFDELMTKTLPQGYEVKPDFADGLDPATDAVLYCKFGLGSYQHGYSNYEQESDRAKKLMDFVNRGGHVVVATECIDYYDVIGGNKLLESYGLCYSEDRLVRVVGDRVKIDKLHAKKGQYLSDVIIAPGHKLRDLDRVGFGYYAITYKAEKMKKEKVEKDTLTWVADNHNYCVSPLIDCNPNLYNFCQPHHEVLMTYNFHHWHKEALAFREAKKSGGTITFVATPLIFSNYGIMDDETRQIAQRLLTPIQDRHLVRIVGVNKPDQPKVYANKDEFSFIRKHRSLNYAFKLLLLVMVLGFINYSRRRMRAIPLLPKEKNVTLDFARFMGTFHYRRHDYKQVVLNQYETMLCMVGESTVQDVTRMDVSELRDEIVAKTQLPPSDVGMLIRTVIKLNDPDEMLNQQDMMKLLDIIREIKEHYTVS